MGENNNHFISGREQFLVDMKIKNIINQLNVDEYNIATYDLEEAALTDALNDAYTIPFLNENKVVILKNPYFLTSSKIKSAHDNDPDKLVDYLRNSNPQTTLIIKSYYPDIDNRKKIVKEIKALTNFESCDYIDVELLHDWTKKQFDKKSIKIDHNTITELLERCEFKMQNITNEMQKILNYLGNDKVVGMNLIQELVPRSIEQNVFNLTNALFENNKQEIIEIYHDLIDAVVNPILILGTLSSYLQNVLYVKTMLLEGYQKRDIEEVLNLSSGRAYYAIKTAKNVKKEDIDTLIVKLSDTDYAIKSGEIDRNLGLDMFIYGI